MIKVFFQLLFFKQLYLFVLLLQYFVILNDLVFALSRFLDVSDEGLFYLLSFFYFRFV